MSIAINVFNIVGNSFCVEESDGQKVFEMITKAFRNHSNIHLSFQNVEVLTTTFLDTAIGQLYRDFTEDEIKMGISVKDMHPVDMALLKRAIDTAKLFYKDSTIMQRSFNETMGM